MAAEDKTSHPGPIYMTIVQEADCGVAVLHQLAQPAVACNTGTPRGPVCHFTVSLWVRLVGFAVVAVG